MHAKPGVDACRFVDLVEVRHNQAGLDFLAAHISHPWSISIAQRSFHEIECGLHPFQTLLVWDANRVISYTRLQCDQQHWFYVARPLAIRLHFHTILSWPKKMPGRKRSPVWEN